MQIFFQQGFHTFGFCIFSFQIFFTKKTLKNGIYRNKLHLLPKNIVRLMVRFCY